MSYEKLSDEVINAFVDGELDADERLHVLRMSEEDDEVRRRICAARGLKDWVRNAYEEVPDVDWGANKAAGRRSKGPSAAMAAGIAMLCLVAGLFGGRMMAPGAPEPIASADPVFLELSELFSLGEAKLARHGSVSNIMLHVQTNDDYLLDEALTKIETFLEDQRRTGHPVNVEIVANGYGLDLMRVAQTPYEARIKALAQSDHLTLVACRRAISRLEQAGVDVDLIPEADDEPAALDRIIQRLQEGWVYVKV